MRTPEEFWQAFQQALSDQGWEPVDFTPFGFKPGSVTVMNGFYRPGPKDDE